MTEIYLWLDNMPDPALFGGLALLILFFLLLERRVK